MNSKSFIDSVILEIEMMDTVYLTGSRSYAKEHVTEESDWDYCITTSIFKQRKSDILGLGFTSVECTDLISTNKDTGQEYHTDNTIHCLMDLRLGKFKINLLVINDYNWIRR